MMTRDESYRRIEREAREQSEALTLALESVPLELGQDVAWTFHGHMGATDHFSPIHRVGLLDGATRETYCGEEIPPAVRRIAVDMLWREMLDVCKSCSVMQAASAGVAESRAHKDAA